MRWVALVLACACGYRFTAPGGPLPSGIRAVQAPVLNNVTPEPNAEQFFTQALREQLIRSGTLGGDAAEARIEGTVLGVSQAPMVIAAGGRVTYRLSATVELRLIKDGAVLAQTTVSGEEDVLSAANITGVETNRGAGLRRLADTLMREGYERLCTGW